MPTPPLTLLPVVLAAVFLAAGAAKLRRPEGVLETLRNFGFPKVFHNRFVAVALPAAEVVLGAALVATSGWTFAVAAIATTATMMIFLFVTTRSLIRGETFDCGCFGAARSPISRAIVLRNVLLLIVSLGNTLLAMSGFAGVMSNLGSFTSDDIAWSAIVVLLVGLGAAFALSTEGVSRDDAIRPQSYLESLTGSTLPDLYLSTNAAEPVRLLDMVDARPQLIIAVSPGCQGCAALLSDTDALHRRLAGDVGLLLVVTGDHASFLEEHPELEAVSLFGAWTLTSTLRLSAFPGAVLVARGGAILAEPVAGRVAILNLAERSASLVDPHESRDDAPS